MSVLDALGAARKRHRGMSVGHVIYNAMEKAESKKPHDWRGWTFDEMAGFYCTQSSDYILEKALRDY